MPSSLGSSSGSARSQPSSLDESTHEQSISSPNTSIISNSETQEDHRTVVRDDLGPIPEVTAEFMLEHIVPNSNVDIETTIIKLQEANILSEDSQWKVLDGLNSQTPANTEVATESGDAHISEMESFSRMKYLYNSIISHTQFHDQRSKEPTLTFEHLAHTSPASHRASKAGPHSCGSLTRKKDLHTKHLKVPLTRNGTHNKESKPSVSKMRWFDTACVWAYKATNRTQDLNENVLDMVWSLDHIMQLDHRRRFIFGITVENEDTRIWFTCREVLFVSQPLNPSTHASQLVQLIASLAYATPTQLGYDPTMKLRWRDNSFRYDIECTTREPDGSERTVLYQTQKVLSDTASDLRGRATRVYLALALEQNELSAANHLVVLKDAWIDADCPTEGDTHRKLLEGASEDQKKLFLKIYQHGIVQVDHQDDSTQHLILKGQNIEVTDLRSRTYGQCPDFTSFAPAGERISTEGPDIGIFKLYTLTEKDFRTSLWKTQYQYRSPPGAKQHHFIPIIQEPDVHSHKVHYRIVFDEIGESLKKIAKSGNATIRILQQVMLDITKALQYMAKKGYVHRDVSAGNILWFGNHAKLSDLEFAQEYGTGSFDAYTGTYKFMSGEVMAGEYFVQDRATDPDEDEDTEQTPRVQFIYNPVHDLESLWWVGAWCSVCFFPPPVASSPQKGLGDENLRASTQTKYNYRDLELEERHNLTTIRQHCADELFPPSQDYYADLRMRQIHYGKTFKKRLAGSMSPPFYHAFTYCLHAIRQCISSAHREIHVELPRTDASYFTDILHIAAPEDLWRHDPTKKGTKMFIHDMILQVIGLFDKLAEAEDVKLWPIQFVEQYRGYIAKHREELCSQEDCDICEDLEF